MTPRESISIIENMINLTKGSVRENAWYFYFFGVLVIICSLLNLMFMRMGIPEGGIVWGLMAIGGVIAGIRGYRLGKSGKASTHIDKLYGYIWLAFGLSFIVIFIGLAKLSDAGMYLINPITFALAAGATFLSGQLMKFNPFVFGGLAMFAIAIVQLFVGPQAQLLLNVLAVSIGYLLPAFLLSKS